MTISYGHETRKSVRAETPARSGSRKGRRSGVQACHFLTNGNGVAVRSGKGFTLLEVIIALAILGIGLTVIMELFSGGLRLGRVSQEYTRAMHFASLKLEEMTAQKTIEAGEDEGEFDKTFRWRTGVEKVDILPYDKGSEFKPPVDLYHIRVNVLWTSGSKERSAGLESYKTVKPAS